MGRTECLLRVAWIPHVNVGQLGNMVEHPNQRTCPHLYRPLTSETWVGLTMVCCLAAQPILPNFRLPKQNGVDSGMTKIKVNSTLVSEDEDWAPRGGRLRIADPLRIKCWPTDVATASFSSRWFVCGCQRGNGRGPRQSKSSFSPPPSRIQQTGPWSQRHGRTPPVGATCTILGIHIILQEY